MPTVELRGAGVRLAGLLARFVAARSRPEERIAGWDARAERGSTLVETAVTMPLLLLATLALLQLGLYAHAQRVVTSAAQEGARVAAGAGQTLDDGVAHAQALLRAGLGRSAEHVALRAEDDGEAIRFSASGQLRVIIPWTSDASLPLAARSIVSKERFRAGGVALVR